MKKIYALSTLFFLTLGAFAQQNQTWIPVSNIPSGVHHPVTFAIGDFGYSITGTSSLGADTDKMYRYNPKTDTWATMADFPGNARGFAIGLAYKGSGYLGFGAGSGQYFKDLWRFDTSNNQWTRLADCTCPARRHPAFMAANDKIYLGFGNDNTSDLRDFYVYDIPTDSWSQLPNIPGAARHHPFMFAVNGNVYAGMGHGGNFIYDDWYTLDTVNNSWQRLNDFPGEARVAGTQFDHMGHGYVLSGDGDNHGFMATGEMWRYDDAGDSWTQLSPHPGNSRWAPGSFVIGDTLYFFGGFDRVNLVFPLSMYKYAFNSEGIGLDETPLNSALFSPNPSTGIVRLNQEREWTEAGLYDLRGAELNRWTGKLKDLDLSGFEPELYILELKDSRGTVLREKILLRN